MESSTQYTKLKENLNNFEKAIKIKFNSPDLLATAFVHKSYLNEHRDEKVDDNERLEFLGDAVLELVATEYLYAKFPDTGEGELTAFRSALVKGKHLAEVSRSLNIGDYLLLSHGEEKSKGREKSYILANALEALIGAIYLDRGFEASHKFITDFILVNLGEILRQGLHVDAKSQFQEYAQDKFGVTPLYRVLADSGPDHNKVFDVGVYVGEELAGRGEGSSKQKAEEAAAEAAVKKAKLK